MPDRGFDTLGAELAAMRPVRAIGRVVRAEAGVLHLSGLARAARLGDRLRLGRKDAPVLGGEVVRIAPDEVVMLPDSAPDGVSLGDAALLIGPVGLAPDDSWIGRVIDPFGQPLDGRALRRGAIERSLRTAPPPPTGRGGFGPRLETGMCIFNTCLPIVEGQRLGLFSGSGVGKSQLLGHFARRLEAEVCVVALIGERGRELRDFLETTLGPDGLARTVVVAATSDMSPLIRRRCAWAAMTVAEHFRDQGRKVLFLADSVTRFAEAHREVAMAAGEMPALRGYPPSTAHLIMHLCERAGPGRASGGAITAILSVLVAGSDMDEPVADILRGVLDGHIVLDRRIAERGRYPAVDLLRSISRSLPAAVGPDENAAIVEARGLLAAYEQSEMMIRAGLYTRGSDAVLDRAIDAWPELDAFQSERDEQGGEAAFNRLRLILRRAGASGPRRDRMGKPADTSKPVPPAAPGAGAPRLPPLAGLH